jgi:hypothetical protein
MSFNFAGLGSVAALGEQLDLYQRIMVGIGDLFDPAKIEANALMCKRAQTEALEAMRRSADAQRVLDSRENDLNTRERALAAREARSQDLEERESKLNVREAQVSEREEALASAKRELRERLKAA